MDKFLTLLCLSLCLGCSSLGLYLLCLPLKVCYLQLSLSLLITTWLYLLFHRSTLIFHCLSVYKSFSLGLFVKTFKSYPLSLIIVFLTLSLHLYLMIYRFSFPLSLCSTYLIQCFIFLFLCLMHLQKPVRSLSAGFFVLTFLPSHTFYLCTFCPFPLLSNPFKILFLQFPFHSLIPLEWPKICQAEQAGDRIFQLNP